MASLDEYPNLIDNTDQPVCPYCSGFVCREEYTRCSKCGRPVRNYQGGGKD